MGGEVGHGAKLSRHKTEASHACTRSGWLAQRNIDGLGGQAPGQSHLVSAKSAVERIRPLLPPGATTRSVSRALNPRHTSRTCTPHAGRQSGKEDIARKEAPTAPSIGTYGHMRCSTWHHHRAAQGMFHKGTSHKVSHPCNPFLRPSPPPFRSHPTRKFTSSWSTPTPSSLPNLQAGRGGSGCST